MKINDIEIAIYAGICMIIAVPVILGYISAQNGLFTIFISFTPVIIQSRINLSEERARISDESEKIAKTFYGEIKNIRNEFSLGIPNDHLIKLGYIYSEHGLYFVYRKEVYAFNEELSKKMVNFYEYMIGVNAYIKVSKGKGETPDFSPMIQRIVESADPILGQLEKQFPRLKRNNNELFTSVSRRFSFSFNDFISRFSHCIISCDLSDYISLNFFNFLSDMNFLFFPFRNFISCGIL